jgi:putative membrane protein
MKIILRLLVTAALAFILAKLLSGIHVKDYGTAIIFALVLAILNALVRPLLILFTLPLTLITFGLFLFIVNTIVVLMASSLVDGFKIDSFWWGLLFSLLLSFTTSWLFKQEDKQQQQKG